MDLSKKINLITSVQDAILFEQIELQDLKIRSIRLDKNLFEALLNLVKKVHSDKDAQYLQVLFKILTILLSNENSMREKFVLHYDAPLLISVFQGCYQAIISLVEQYRCSFQHEALHQMFSITLEWCSQLKYSAINIAVYDLFVPVLTMLGSSHFDWSLKTIALTHFIRLLAKSKLSFEIKTEMLKYRQLLSKVMEYLFFCGNVKTQFLIIEFCFRVASFDKAKREFILRDWLPAFNNCPDFISLLNIQKFQTSCRAAINLLNQHIQFKMKVYTLACLAVTVNDEVKLVKPKDSDYKEFWVDFSCRSGIIYFCCDGCDTGSEWVEIEIGTQLIQNASTSFHKNGKSLRHAVDCKKLHVDLNDSLNTVIGGKLIAIHSIQFYFRQNEPIFKKVERYFFSTHYSEIFLNEKEPGLVQHMHDESADLLHAPEGSPFSSSSYSSGRKHSLVRDSGHKLSRNDSGSTFSTSTPVKVIEERRPHAFDASMSTIPRATLSSDRGSALQHVHCNSPRHPERTFSNYPSSSRGSSDTNQTSRPNHVTYRRQPHPTQVSHHRSHHPSPQCHQTSRDRSMHLSHSSSAFNPSTKIHPESRSCTPQHHCSRLTSERKPSSSPRQSYSSDKSTSGKPYVSLEKLWTLNHSVQNQPDTSRNQYLDQPSSHTKTDASRARPSTPKVPLTKELLKNYSWASRPIKRNSTTLEEERKRDAMFEQLLESRKVALSKNNNKFNSERNTKNMASEKPPVINETQSSSEHLIVNVADKNFSRNYSRQPPPTKARAKMIAKAIQEPPKSTPLASLYSNSKRRKLFNPNESSPEPVADVYEYVDSNQPTKSAHHTMKRNFRKIVSSPKLFDDASENSQDTLDMLFQPSFKRKKKKNLEKETPKNKGKEAVQKTTPRNLRSRTKKITYTEVSSSQESLATTTKSLAREGARKVLTETPRESNYFFMASTSSESNQTPAPKPLPSKATARKTTKAPAKKTTANEEKPKRAMAKKTQKLPKKAVECSKTATDKESTTTNSTEATQPDRFVKPNTTSVSKTTAKLTSSNKSSLDDPASDKEGKTRGTCSNVNTLQSIPFQSPPAAHKAIDQQKSLSPQLNVSSDVELSASLTASGKPMEVPETPSPYRTSPVVLAAVESPVKPDPPDRPNLPQQQLESVPINPNPSYELNLCTVDSSEATISHPHKEFLIPAIPARLLRKTLTSINQWKAQTSTSLKSLESIEKCLKQLNTGQ